MQLTRAELAKTQVIVTTPEKWTVVTNKPSAESDLANVSTPSLLPVHLMLWLIYVPPDSKSSFSSLTKCIYCTTREVPSLKP